MSTESFDAVIVGGGHNGLTCAGYLARAGMRVAVAERRAVVGGACVTEEFLPGFRNSSCSYLVGLLAPEVIADLELARHGLEILERPGGTFNPLPDGDALELTADKQQVYEELSRRSVADADAYMDLGELLDHAARVVRAIVRETPPNIEGGWWELLRSARVARHLRALPVARRAEFTQLFLQSLGDFLDERFGNEAFKGMWGFKGLVGNMVSPYTAGSAYVLLHHVFGEVNGKRGRWGQPRGGMGAITEAMARSLQTRGGTVLTAAPVRELIVEGGRAGGMVLADGRTLRAPVVVSGVNPRLLFQQLMDPAMLPPAFRRRIDNWRCRSGTFRMNVALSELPDFSARPGREVARHHTGTITFAPSLAYLDQAFDDARHRGWARQPVISMCLPTTLDDGLAPKGRHIASLFCQHFNNVLPDGASWDDHRDAVAHLIIDTIGHYAPNFPAAVLGFQTLSPLDLEREYGLIGGDIFHGEMHLDQIFSLRPAAGYADYSTPVPGLYLCGSGSHPGGGVTGLPGMNAAREILRRRRRAA